MNFYKRFIGDIQAKTGGLTLAEFGAYDRLLDHYYSTEQPIAAKEAYRICRAMSAPERAAVDAVLQRFWDLMPEGYVQSKADEVIAKAKPLIEAARANGKKGGRPKKQNPDKTQQVSGNNPAETQGEPSAKAIQSQSQISPSDEGDKPRSRTSPPARPDGVTEGTWADWLQLRRTKRAPVTDTVLSEAEREAGKAGMPLQRFFEIWCMRGSQGLQADWLRADERAPRQSGGKHSAAGVSIFGRAADQQREVIDV